MIKIPHIFNIDDLGATKKSTDCAIELLLNNKADSASLMVNMEYTDYAITLIKKHNLYDKINLHFNLTQGKALSGISSLTDENGYFTVKNKLSNKFLLIDDVIKEFNLQSKIFPFYKNIDCHHNINYYHKEIHDFLLTKTKGYVRNKEIWKGCKIETFKVDRKNFNIYFHPTYENDLEMKIFSPEYDEIRIIEYTILKNIKRL